MPNREDRLNDLHNRGERHYAEGKGYNPPNSGPPILAEIVMDKKMREENRAYGEGYANARKQSKQAAAPVPAD